jgi:hypothetical protein
VDDGEVAHQANLDVVRLQIPDRYRHCGLLQKTGAVDQRFVRIGAIEVLSRISLKRFTSEFWTELT